jgi:4-amino-4-deoxy-L-arabinose transferase-like glycosyltransferase
VVCLALTVPYFWAVEKAAPGFSRFFWIHEHFLRYATPEASRGGPVYYFVLTLFAGFIPWSFFLPGVFARIARSRRAGPEGLSELWFASWAAVILVFFSLSHSKLVPYIFPAAPALAMLLARRLESGSPPRRGLIANAVFWTAAMIAGLWLGSRSGDLSQLGVSALAAGVAAGSVAIFWIAALVSRRNPAGSIAWLPAGWAMVYAAAILALPSFAADQSAQNLALAARDAAGSGASVVSYRTYLQGFPWVLRRRIPIYGWKNELEFGSRRGDQSAFFRPREDFWKDWDSEKKIVALLRKRDRPEMKGHRGALVAENRNYIVVRNF